MASLPAPDRTAGYASATAIAVSLSLALVATALMSRSVVALRSARADFARTQAEYDLAVVQERSAIALVTNTGSTPASAEPEAAKIDLATAADLEPRILALFGVKDAGRLSAWLLAASVAPVSPAELVAADASPRWKACAPAAISSFGRAKSVAAPVGATSSGSGPASHLGEVWRFSASSTKGWTDERIVRFTGEPQRPAVVIWRRFYRSTKGGVSCAAIFAQAQRG